MFNKQDRGTLALMLNDSLYLPALSDTISAGFPSSAEGYEDEPLNLHDWLVRSPAATFFFRVEGDALRHDHIRDGSIPSSIAA